MIGPGAASWLVEAAAAGTRRIKAKMAEAVTLAKQASLQRGQKINLDVMSNIGVRRSHHYGDAAPVTPGEGNLAWSTRC